MEFPFSDLLDDDQVIMGPHEGASRFPSGVHPCLYPCNGIDVQVDLDAANGPNLLKHLRVQDVDLHKRYLLLGVYLHHPLLHVNQRVYLLQVLMLICKLTVVTLNQLYPDALEHVLITWSIHVHALVVSSSV